MSSFLGFDSRLHITYAYQASKDLGRDYWVVDKEFKYFIGKLGSDEFVSVPRGYLTDGASIPGFARVFVPRMGSHTQASILHDWMCEHYIKYKLIDGEPVEVPITRKEIDGIYYEALKVTEVSGWRIFFIKLGVTLFRWIKRPKKPKPYYKKKWIEREFKERNPEYLEN